MIRSRWGHDVNTAAARGKESTMTSPRFSPARQRAGIVGALGLLTLAVPFFVLRPNGGGNDGVGSSATAAPGIETSDTVDGAVVSSSPPQAGTEHSPADPSTSPND